MPNPFLNQGAGTPLRPVTDATSNVFVGGTPPPVIIPDGSWSETFQAQEGLDVKLLFIFAAAATGDVLIEQVIDAAASVAGETFATVSFVAKRIARFSAGEPLTGFFRIKNMSGQNLTCYYNNAKARA